MQEFEGRVAVVTGAASGMGKSFAERFAQEGMQVVLSDIEEQALEATATEFRQKEYDVTAVVTDVSSAGSVEALAKKAVDAYGKIHIVCNNAGVVAPQDLGNIQAGGFKPIWELSLNDWEWTFNVNFWGVVHGIRTFLPLMLEHGEPGHVLNTSSIAGLTSGAGLPIYGATKHGVVRITEALELQLRAMDSKIHASVLCPGGVQTRIVAAARNRPGELSDGSDPDESIRDDAERNWNAGTAMLPAAVADMVFDAIRSERFYILPHDDFDGVIRQRMENILARENPAAAPF